MGGGEGDVPSSSDGLPNVGNGVADILAEIHRLSVLGVFGIVTANAESQILVCILLHMFRASAERAKTKGATLMIAGPASSARRECVAVSFFHFCRLSFLTKIF